MSKEYGSASPANMLEAVAADLAASGISEERSQELERNHIWAMLLSADGKCDWALFLPEEIPTQCTIQDRKDCHPIGPRRVCPLSQCGPHFSQGFPVAYAPSLLFPDGTNTCMDGYSRDFSDSS